MSSIARSPGQVGQVIQGHRRAQGMSQTQLGTLAGLRQEMISKIEGGQKGVKLSTVCDVLAALGLEMTIAPRTKSSAADIADIF